MNSPQKLSLRRGQVYSWEQVASKFGFKPGYFAQGGGMLKWNATNSLLLITQPDSRKSHSNTYVDYWQGSDLWYSGRKRIGDMSIAGANRDVFEGGRDLYVFEATGSKSLRYVGSPVCTDVREGRGKDAEGNMRRVYQFRLSFKGANPGRSGEGSPARKSMSRERERRFHGFRKFDPNRLPRASRSANGWRDPEEALALNDKRQRGHQRILVSLAEVLTANGWETFDIHGAIDLLAIRGEKHPQQLIFEAKTISDKNEPKQCRAALAQLLEYRLEIVPDAHAMCLCTDRPFSLRRMRMLNQFEVAVLWCARDVIRAGNDLGTRLMADIQMS